MTLLDSVFFCAVVDRTDLYYITGGCRVRVSFANRPLYELLALQRLLKNNYLDGEILENGLLENYKVNDSISADIKLGDTGLSWYNDYRKKSGIKHHDN